MPQVKFNYNMSFDAISNGIKSCKSRSAKVKEDMHKINVSILNRWSETNDVTVPCGKATEAVKGCDAHYAQGLVNWFTVYAGFEWDEETEAFKYTKTTISKDEVVKAKGETFEQLSPPREPKAFNLDERIKNLIRAAKSKREKGIKEGFDNINEDHLKALEAIVS